MVALQNSKRVGEYGHDKELLVHTTCDLGYDDNFTWIFFQTIGKSVYIIDYFQDSRKGLPHYIKMLKDKAKEHIQDLKKMIDNSIYRDFLIDRAVTEEDLLKDERSKIDTIYLRNPENPSSPTKIIALGITSAGSLISFKRVCHIHMSDVTLADMTEERFTEAFGGAFSRLANTDGSLVIECPPRGPSGPVFNIVDEDDSLKKDGITVELEEGKKILTPSGFMVRKYTYQVGIDCGMITSEFIEKEKRRLGVLFGMYYLADFYSTDQTWFDKESINQTSAEATEAYDAL